MKLNWGHKLVFFTVLFMLFIIAMVYSISTQKMDLVDNDYYEKGMRYQEEINKFNEASIVHSQIDFDLSNGLVTFKCNNIAIRGTLYLYRAANASMDFNIPFGVNEEGIFNYKTNGLAKGIWKLTYEWTLNGKLMAAEKQIVIE